MALSGASFYLSLRLRNKSKWNWLKVKWYSFRIFIAWIHHRDAELLLSNVNRNVTLTISLQKTKILWTLQCSTNRSLATQKFIKNAFIDNGAHTILPIFYLETDSNHGDISRLHEVSRFHKNLFDLTYTNNAPINSVLFMPLSEPELISQIIPTSGRRWMRCWGQWEEKMSSNDWHWNLHSNAAWSMARMALE